MAGRFIAPAFLMAVALLSVTPLGFGAALTVAAGVLFFGLWNIQATILSGLDFTNEEISDKGIADERGYYFQQWGLMSDHGAPPEVPDWTATGNQAFGGVNCAFMGFRGITSGPDTSWIDNCALTDPVLARLPAKQREDWRIGHYYRQVPTNYEYAHRGDPTRLTDPEIAELVRLVHSVTRGDLWDRTRWEDIYRLHRFQLSPDTFTRFQTAQFPARDITNADLARYDSRTVDIAILSEAKPDGSGRYDTGNMYLPERGMELRPDTAPKTRIRLGLPAPFPYYLFVESNGRWQRYDIPAAEGDNLRERTVDLPEPVVISRLRIIPATIEDIQTISHVIIE